MADVKKIQGFNIKDEVAREQVDEVKNEWLYKTQSYNPNSLTSIILGSYAVDWATYLPSAVLFVNKKVYCFNPTENVNNRGELRIYNLDNNTLEETKTILMGHANSVCYDYDNHFFYVVMNWDYSTNSGSNKILKYDTSFNLVQTIEAEERIGAISFDSVRRKIYVKASSWNFYELEQGVLNLLGTLNLPDLNLVDRYGNAKWNQAMACYNGKAFLSSPYRRVCVVEIDTFNILNNFILTDTDYTYRRILKELEDFEFTEDGHLVAMRRTNANDQVNLAYVCELPVNETPSWTSPNDGFDIFRFGYQLNETNINQFFKGINYLNSLTELRACCVQPMRVEIIGNVVENVRIDIVADVDIIVTGTYTCKFIDNFAKLSLRGGGTLIFTGDYDIYTSGKGSLHFNSNNILNITPHGTDIDLAIANYLPLITVRRKPNNTKGGTALIKGTTELANDSAYIGVNRITLT